MNTHRRSFLKGAAAGSAALAFPSILPSSAWGATAPSRRVHLAAIGVGGRGGGNCMHNFAPREDVRFLAVADCFRSRRESFAGKVNKQYGQELCRPYADYREVLARDDIDGVVISTPDHWHVPVAVQAALAGKDMYVEKPLSIAMAWAMRLREVAQEKEIVFQYGTQQRSGKAARTAVDLVQNGYIGTLKRVDVWSPNLNPANRTPCTPEPVPEDLDYETWIGPAPMKPYCKVRCTNTGAWHCYDYALGFIAGWGAHPLDILQWGLQRDDTGPVQYQGKGFLPPEGDLLNTVRTWDVNCTYADGLPVRFMSADVAKPEVMKYHVGFKSNGTTFHGSEGWVSYSRGACYMSRKGEMVNTSNFSFKESDQRTYVSDSQAGNFVDCIKNRKPTINPLESAIRSDTISHLSDLCIRTGKEIRWDPKSETIVGDAETSALLTRPVRAPWKVG